MLQKSETNTEELVWVLYNEVQQMRKSIEQMVALQDNRAWLRYEDAKHVWPVSQRTMDRKVKAGLLKMEQEAPGCTKFYNRWDLEKLFKRNN